MGSKNRKRLFDDYRNDQRDTNSNSVGIGNLLARLKGSSPSSSNDTSAAELKTAEDEEGDWQLVGRANRKRQKKKEKKERASYPGFSFGVARQQGDGAVKLGDLRSLVLYLIADNVAPTWLAVKNANRIPKVVVLMVPGLEEGMFTGKIPLSSDTGQIGDGSGVSEVGNSGDADATANGDAFGAQRAPDRPRESQDSDFTRWKNGSPINDPLRDRRHRAVPLSELRLPKFLEPLAEIFTHLLPTKTPGDSRYPKIYSPVQIMLTSPLPKPRDGKTKGTQPPREENDRVNQRTPITAFVHSAEELLENEYVLHPALRAIADSTGNQATDSASKMNGPEKGWVDSAVVRLEDGEVPDADVEHGSLSAGREVLALDCEMCLTEGGVSELARISIVGWDGSVVIDELVKPDKPIIDYLTQYSGITEAMLKPITTTLADIQARLLKLLTPRTILIGHSLNADLTALKLTHPFIVDTSIIFPHPRGPPLKSSLKFLAQRYLRREIQKGDGKQGHNSVEDAEAVLDLVKQKCERGESWGTSESSGEDIFARISRGIKPSTKAQSGGVGAVIDRGHVTGPPPNVLNFHCDSDQDIVDKVKRAVRGDPDGKTFPGNGITFTWARLRDLEAFRGWWNGDDRDAKHQPVYVDYSSSISWPTTTEQEQQQQQQHHHHHQHHHQPTDPRRLADQISETVSHIAEIYRALPPCTALVVYSGTGDPRGFGRLQGRKKQFTREYVGRKVKWDDLSVQWTDADEEALKEACLKARASMALLTVK